MGCFELWVLTYDRMVVSFIGVWSPVGFCLLYFISIYFRVLLVFGLLLAFASFILFLYIFIFYIPPPPLHNMSKSDSMMEEHLFVVKGISFGNCVPWKMIFENCIRY